MCACYDGAEHGDAVTTAGLKQVSMYVDIFVWNVEKFIFVTPWWV